LFEKVRESDIVKIEIFTKKAGWV